MLLPFSMHNSSLPKMRQSQSYSTLSLPPFKGFTVISSSIIPKRNAFADSSLMDESSLKLEVVNAPISSSSRVRQTRRILCLLSMLSWKLRFCCCLKLYSLSTEDTSLPTILLSAYERGSGNSCWLLMDMMMLACREKDISICLALLYRTLFSFRKEFICSSFWEMI